MGRIVKPGLKLTPAELQRAFQGTWETLYPPILNPGQAAQLAGVTIKTLYDWSHRGLLRQCAIRRGRHLRIFRDRFMEFLFSTEDQSHVA